MTTKHVTGYKRSVIQKKPKKYTPAYNYITNQWRQSPTPNHDLAKDRRRAAKEPGWRPVYDKNGNVDHYYFERRANRSDTQKQRRTALGLRARDSRYGMQRKGVIIDRQKPKTILIIPEIPTATTGGKYYNPESKHPLSETQLKALIRKTELSIHTKPIEHCYVFDIKNGIAFTNTGTIKNVDIGKLRGKNYIITHNHPHGGYPIPSPLSGADIKGMLLSGVTEIRACSYGYVYRIKPGIADTTRASYYSKIYNTRVTKAFKILKSNLKPFEYYQDEPEEKTKERIYAYKLEYAKLGSKTLEGILEQFCKEYGFWYKKERI